MIYFRAYAHSLKMKVFKFRAYAHPKFFVELMRNLQLELVLTMPDAIRAYEDPPFRAYACPDF